MKKENKNNKIMILETKKDVSKFLLALSIVIEAKNKKGLHQIYNELKE